MKNTTGSAFAELTALLRQKVGPGESILPGLERSLVPMVRLALVRGLGPDAVVRWVQDEARKYPEAQRSALVRPLARELGEQLLNRYDPLPARETLVGI